MKLALFIILLFTGSQLASSSTGVFDRFFRRHSKIFNANSRSVTPSECVDLFKDKFSTQEFDTWSYYYSEECQQLYAQTLFTAAFQAVDQSDQFLVDIAEMHGTITSPIFSPHVQYTQPAFHCWPPLVPTPHPSPLEPSA